MLDSLAYKLGNQLVSLLTFPGLAVILGSKKEI